MELTIERTIARPYRYVAPVLTARLREWLPGLRTHGDEVETNLDVRLGGSKIVRTVVVRASEPSSGPDTCELIGR